MNITCPNCKKTYAINPNKIPPNITTAKCKACGHSMPLTPAPPKKLAADTNACRITCLYCSRHYSLDRSKIPPDVATVKCKACGHSISLNQVNAETTTPVKNTQKITCLYCSKRYTIDRNKIPKGVTTTKCKSCGHVIPLVHKQSAILSKNKEPEPTGAYLKASNIPTLAQPISQMQAPLSAPLWKKPWLLAAVFAMIVLGITVFYTASHFSQFFGGGASKEPANVTKSQFQATNLPRPFMRINVNVPLALQILDKHLPEEKKDADYTKMVFAVNSLNLRKIQFYFFLDSRQTVLPVAILHSSKPKSLKTRIKKAVAIHTTLERMPDGSYRLKKNAIPNGIHKKFPIDLFRIHFWKHGAVIAPKSLLPDLENPEILKQTLVAQMAASIETPRDLAVVSVRMPENFQKGWEKKINTLPGVKENPQMATVADTGGGILVDMTESFENIEAMTLGLHFNGKSGRTLSYAQIFRKNVEGAKIYRQLKSGNTDALDAQGIIVNLIELFQNPQYKNQIHFEDNKLALEFTWFEKDDKAFLSELSNATIGQLFAQSMQLKPKKGPISRQ